MDGKYLMQTQINEATVGFQSGRAVVMVARCQPPTLGHYKVIDAMKAFIRNNKTAGFSATPFVVIINGAKSSENKAKNPLTPEERIKFMEASGNANGVKFLVADNAFAGFEAVRKLGFEPIAIAAGSDRAAKYLDMLDKYFTNNGEKVKHYIVPGLEREDADDDAEITAASTDTKIDVTKVSGSMARAAVEAGYEDVFADIVGLKSKPKLAKMMFDKIKTAMQG